MKFEDIRYYETINATEESHVAEIVKSIKANGWMGAPILVAGESLVTGSHRLAALEILYNEFCAGEYEGEVFEQEIAEDVSEIIEEYAQNEIEEYGYFDGIQYDNLGKIFAGTWVEDYKNEIEEW